MILKRGGEVMSSCSIHVVGKVQIKVSNKAMFVVLNKRKFDSKKVLILEC